MVINQRLVLPITLSLLLLGPAAPEVAGLDPSRQISQYAHTAWRLQDGYLSGIPASIVQSSDGYLWIGTQGALFRFDGVRFVQWNAPAGQKLPSDNINYLAPDKDGGLWIGTSSGLAHWTGKELISFAPGGRVNQVVLDPQGNPWIVRARTHDNLGPLCEVVGAGLECHGVPDGIPINYAGQLAQDAMGNFWIGATDKLVRWRPRSSTTYSIQALKAETGLSGVQDIVVGPDNSLWVGMDRSGRSLGLQQFSKGQWKPLVTPTFDSSTLELGKLFFDRNGDLWAGTSNKGIYRIHEHQVDHFDSSNGLSGDSVNGFLEDREGNIWVVTSSGIDSFRDLPVATFSTRQGLSSDLVHSILAAHDGTVWIGNTGSLDSIRDGRVSSIRAHKGLPGQEVTTILEDRKNQLWVGVDNALYLYGNSRFTPVPGFEGKPAGLIYSIAESGDHTVWGASVFAQLSRLVRFADGKAQQKFEPPQMPQVYRVEGDPSDGVWVSFVGKGLTRYRDGMLDSDLLKETAALHKLSNFFIDADGSAWIGTSEGLAVLRQGALRVLGARNGLPCDPIYSLLRDAHQALWLYSHCGLIRIEKTELDRWWANPNATIKTLTLDVFSGAQPALATFAPAATRSPDGRLWFANDSVVQMVDPDHLDLNPTPPPVRIEQVLAQGRSYTASNELRLPSHTRDIQIDYTALSFASPERALFRVMLEDHDSQWMDVGARRSAFYTNLGPGTYRFRVRACNNDGVWNETGADLTFTILPSFTQGKLFKAICLFAFAALVYSAYLLRVRQVTRQLHARMFERLAERERIARDLHDTFFQGIQGLLLRFHTATSQLQQDEPVRQIFEETLKQSDQVMLEGRELVLDLRATVSEPSDLPTAIADFGEEMRKGGSFDFRVVVNGSIRSLHPIVFEELFKIGKEALGNAFRHSGAHSIEAELNYEPSELRMRVRDDGAGIESAILRQGHRDGHFGLPGMRERAQKVGAHLDVWSRPGAGTEIELRLGARVAYASNPNGSWIRKLRRLWNGDKDGDSAPARTSMSA
jgi:signal transduction histidine kinase/ligand-binding sensor domain-containing protein